MIDINNKIIDACINDGKHIDTYQNSVNTIYNYVVNLTANKKTIIRDTHIAKIDNNNYMLAICCWFEVKNKIKKCMTIFFKSDIFFDNIRLLIPEKLCFNNIYLFNYDDNIYLCNYEKQPLIYQLFIIERMILQKKYNNLIIDTVPKILGMPIVFMLDKDNFKYLQIISNNNIMLTTSYKSPSPNQQLSIYINNDTELYKYDNNIYYNLTAVTSVIKYNNYYIGIFSYINSKYRNRQLCFYYFELENNKISMIKITKMDSQQYFFPNSLIHFGTKIIVSGYTENSVILVEYSIDNIINGVTGNLLELSKSEYVNRKKKLY